MTMIVFDTEIVNAIETNDSPRVEGIEYCAGWRDFANMGIACITAYEWETYRYRVFTKGNLEEFQALIDASDLVVGFNSYNFDGQLLAANGFDLPDDKHYDLLREIWAGNGLGPVFVPATHGGYGLDAVADSNLGERKSGNGALAPVLWQQGNIGAVIDYCLQDTRLTQMLVSLVVDDGELINPKTGERMKVRSPL